MTVSTYEVCTKTRVVSVKPPSVEAINNGAFFGKRHWLILILTLLFFTTRSVEAYMAVCVLTMIGPAENSYHDTTANNWLEWILPGFFWGFCLSPLFAGWLVSKYKSKWPTVSMLMICSVVGFLIPTAADFIGPTGVTICRIIQGFSMGSLIPFVHYLYGQWIPPNERSALVGIVYSGSMFSTLIAVYLRDKLVANLYVWLTVNYVYSSLCLVWCFVCVIFISNNPAEHSTISKEEQFYIEQSLLQIQKQKQRNITPYKKIFSSVPVWANIVYRFGGCLGSYTLLVIPGIYLKDVLNIDIKSGGFLNMLPYIAPIFSVYLSGFLSDLAITRRIYSMTITRKMMAYIGGLVPSVILILLGQFDPEDGQAKVIIFVALLLSADISGTLHSTTVNTIDLAPNHCGTLEGIVNQICQIGVVGGTVLTQYMITDKKNLCEWKIVFFIVAGVKILTTLIFLFFGSSETQPWNKETFGNTNEDSVLQNKEANDIPLRLLRYSEV